VDRMSRAETTSPPVQGDDEGGAGLRVKVDKMDIASEGNGTRELHESADKVEAVAFIVRTAAEQLHSYPLSSHATPQWLARILHSGPFPVSSHPFGLNSTDVQVRAAGDGDKRAHQDQVRHNPEPRPSLYLVVHDNSEPSSFHSTLKAPSGTPMHIQLSCTSSFTAPASLTPVCIRNVSQLPLPARLYASHPLALPQSR